MIVILSLYHSGSQRGRPDDVEHEGEGGVVNDIENAD